MKKAVFLLLIFACFNTNTLFGSNYETHYFNDYEIRLTYYSDEDSNRGYHLEKLGVDPFSVEIMYDDTWVIINGIREVDGNHVLFGSIHHEDNGDIYDTFYDTFLLVLSPLGEELYKETFNYGDLEEIVDVFELDNTIVVYTIQTTEIDREYKFKSNRFTSYDFNYNQIDELETLEEYFHVDQENTLILLSIDYEEKYEMAINASLDRIYSDDILEIPMNEVYTDSVVIPFLNTGILNNEVIQNGIVINYPGDYSFVYNNFTYKFQVVPTVTGVEDGAVYNTPITPVIKSGNIYLNNDLYISGTEISSPGIYSLKIYGNNGFLKEYQFEITSNIQGVMHNQTYSEPIEISFNGNAYLNNAFIQSPYVVSDNGEYILKVEGANNYTETYYFNIDKPEEEKSLIQFVQDFDIIFLIVVVITGGIILKTKK